MTEERKTGFYNQKTHDFIREASEDEVELIELLRIKFPDVMYLYFSKVLNLGDHDFYIMTSPTEFIEKQKHAA